MVVAGLLVGEPDGDGLAVDFAGPAPPGAVQGGRVGVAAAAGRAAPAVACEQSAGKCWAECGQFGEDALAFGLGRSVDGPDTFLLRCLP